MQTERPPLVLAVSGPQDPLRPVGIDTHLAHLTIIEILMVRLAQKLGPVAMHDLQHFKQLMHAYGFESHADIGPADAPPPITS